MSSRLAALSTHCCQTVMLGANHQFMPSSMAFMLCITAPISTRACAPCSLAHTLHAHMPTCAHAHAHHHIYVISYSVSSLFFCIMCVSLSICISARPPSSKPSLNDFSPLSRHLSQGVWLLIVAGAGAGADCLVVRCSACCLRAELVGLCG